jgi:putative heme-binding domain-containing protein
LQLVELLNGQMPTDITSQDLARVGDAYFQLRLQLAMQKPTPIHAAVGIWAFENQLAQFGAEFASLTSETLEPNDPKLLTILQKISQRCDADQQRSLVQLLSSQPHWRPALLSSLTQGWISNRALLVLSSTWWDANANQPWVAELRGLKPDESEEMKQRFEKFVALREQITQSVGTPSAGKQVFTQQCAVCHQFAGQGKVVGPQLEGVGGRGLARLCEDVLMPNQNVDHAFHSTAILTNEGEVVIGLVRQRDNDKIVLADAKGEEKTILRSEIDSEKSSGLSLMPENFGDVLTVQQLSDLMAYLRKPTEAQ